MIEQGNVKLAFFGAIELQICKAILFSVSAYCFCSREEARFSKYR